MAATGDAALFLNGFGRLEGDFGSLEEFLAELLAYWCSWLAG